MRPVARPLAVALGLALAAAPAGAPLPAAATTGALVSQLDQVLAAREAGDAGVWISDPATAAPLYARNADLPVVTASLYKLAVLTEAERRVEARTLSYTSTVTIEPEDITDDGSFFPIGTELTLDEALEQMITWSDNGTAAALLRMLGGRQVNATLAAAGVAGFTVALDRSQDNVASPRAVGTWFTLLAKRTLVSPAASGRIADRLARQHIRDRLPSLLPASALVAHKTGNLPGLSHDAGILQTPAGPRVVVAMTWGMDDGTAAELIGMVGSLVYAAVLGPATNASYLPPRGPLYAETGTAREVAIRVTNRGTRAWTVSGSGSYRLLWELRDPRAVLVSTGTVALPALRPNAAADAAFAVALPAAPGDHRLTFGLVDAAGRALSHDGAAVGNLVLRVHRPFVVSAAVRIPSVLHRGEAHLVTVHYDRLPAAGRGLHSVSLQWRAIDPRTKAVAAQGTTLVGNLLPDVEAGTFHARLIAPALRGTYLLEHELRVGGLIASETSRQEVWLAGPRTYPDEHPDPPSRAAPAAR